MTVIYNSDLSSANSSVMVSELDKAVNTSKELISTIGDFQTSSKGVLVGGGYDAVRAKLSLYSDALTKQQTICSNLSNNLKAANNIMINYMEGYAMLDDAYITDIKNSIEDITTFLNWLKGSSTVTKTDSTGKKTTETVRNGSDAEIESWTNILNEFNHKLELLEKLKPTDDSAFSLLGDTKADVLAYASALAELKLPNFNGVVEDDPDAQKFIDSISLTTTNGKKVFYCQWGWLDENGKYHEWETSWGKNIKSSGCGPTSLAACLATMYGDTSYTPSTIANNMSYDENVGGNFIVNGAKRYGYDYDCHIGADKKASNNLLMNGGTMVVAINGGGHYIAVLGYDPSTNTYTVCDPNNPYKTEWTYNEIMDTHTMVFHIAPPGKTVDECAHPSAVQI